MMLAPELQRPFQVILESLLWVDGQVKNGVVTDMGAGENAPDLRDAFDKAIQDVFTIYRRLGGNNIELSRDD